MNAPQQFAIDFTAERRRRDEGIQTALDHANQTVEDWADLAFLFLSNYARANEFVFGEDVTTAAKNWRMSAPE